MALLYRITLFFIFCSSYCNAQIQLTNFYPASANYQDTLYIVGNGFGNNPGSVSINIGAGTAEIVSIQDQLIKIIVPTTATFGKVIVTDLTNKESLSFSTSFLPSYSASGFDHTHLNNSKKIIPEEAGLYDLCTCDFDQDGDIDIGTVNNDEAAKLSSVNVFSNTSTAPNDVSFAKVQGSYFNINQPARNIKCSDVNGDGKLDLLVSQGGIVAENIYVFQNLSTSSPSVIKFASPIILSTSFEGQTKGTRRVEVYDLDGDHKPEIVVSNQTSPLLIIFKNASTNGVINFPLNQRVFISVPSNTLGLTITDLDGDKKAEIITSNNLGSNFYVIKNNSEKGSLSFTNPQTFTLSGQLVNLVSGDIDGDKKQDLVLTDFEDGAILLLLNQSNSNSISFASPIRMNAAIQPWGIALGDIAGNQQTDIIVSTQAATDKNLILKNNSLPGDPNFELIQAGYPSAYRNINVADINNDSKPDIVCTERDAFGNYYVTYIQNNNCIKAEVFPVNPPAICEVNPLTLYTHPNSKLNYQWTKDGVALSGENGSTLTVHQPGTYALQITDTYSSCLSISENIEITEDSGSIPDAPVIIAPNQVCSGNDLHLSAGSNASLNYFWTGPNGFESTEMNPVIANAAEEHAGEYQLEVRDGLCKSSKSSLFINVVPQSEIVINRVGSLTLCPQDSVIFNIVDPGLSNIQWYKNNQIIVGENSSILSANESGAYHVKAENVSGCLISSDMFEVDKITLDADFSMSTVTACVGDSIEFVSRATNNANLIFAWEYGDGSLSSAQQSMHTYTEAGTYNVSLTIELDNSSCSNTQTQTINILSSPDFEINASSQVVCPNDTITLSIAGNIPFLEWEDGSTNNPRYIMQGGTYSATVTNEFNCSSTQTVTIIQGAVPEIIIDSDGGNRIVLGDSVQLFAQGASTYFWQTSEGLSDSTLANPLAKPKQTTSYVVNGFSEDGCSSTAMLTIYVDIDEIKLYALDIFSPNDDGVEDSWVIHNFAEYPECYFLIFDLQGREVFRSAAPYQNDWSGTNHQGNPLPSGAYYYVIRCGDEKNKASGSVTILR
ncbi:FG-GAP-like repeat-containing protein [Catalinimonas niigatensis]|uniref:FG-GAP-like repeat-containing protein n=1 Tax=Catalinimonas niigatensis TaxID=1397264 RepID=UPI0026663389|nr:FG-GAP-like repeat-containing protein [Catalinimonas niigatensis]WPP51155.1 FG-GAP-like repeat-containing protein [Catalinimonas niigatensis]